MPNSVKLNLDKLNDIQKELKKGYVTNVGVLGSKDSRDKNSNATIGLQHEFGVASKNLPMRSWLRMPLNEKLPEELKNIGKDTMKALTDTDVENLFAKIGIKAEAIIQEAFDTGGFGKWSPLSAKTIESKGFDKKLIETTQLRRSVSSEVVKK